MERESEKKYSMIYDGTGSNLASYKGNINFILCKGIGVAFIKKNIDKTIVKKTIEEFII